MMTDINQMSKVMFALVIVLGLLFVIAFAVKRFKNASYLGGKGITVLSNLLVGHKERIVLLEVDGQRALVGVTANAIQTLLLITKPAVEQPAAVATNNANQFKKILQKQQEVG